MSEKCSWIVLVQTSTAVIISSADVQKGYTDENDQSATSTCSYMYVAGRQVQKEQINRSHSNKNTLIQTVKIFVLELCQQCDALLALGFES